MKETLHVARETSVPISRETFWMMIRQPLIKNKKPGEKRITDAELTNGWQLWHMLHLSRETIGYNAH